jgi:hypothetical protein
MKCPLLAVLGRIQLIQMREINENQKDSLSQKSSNEIKKQEQ